jgi:hypothetical protein
MKIIILTIILTAYMNAAFTQSSTAKTNTQSFESIKVPHFTNDDVLVFFSSYRVSLGDYLKAVRKNNKPAIKKQFDLNVQFGEETYDKLQKAQNVGPGEYQAAQDFLKQLTPFIKEISQHPYVRELSIAYLKTHPQ